MKGNQKIILITAPSGAGKTSITKYLLQQFPQIAFSISAATRKPRAGEVNGKDYYFISEADFKQHIAAADFLEWEMVYEGKYYGTLRSEVNRIWQEQKIPLLDLDVHGAVQVQKMYPGQCLSLFIAPPSLNELRRRLLLRGTETPETLNDRLNKAEYEMSFCNNFDAVLLNDKLEECQGESATLVKNYLQA